MLSKKEKNENTLIADLFMPGAAHVKPLDVNPDAWTPLMDWVDVFPGNRGVNKEGIYEHYDIPTGIEIKVEKALQKPIMISETPWEGKGMILAGHFWKEETKTGNFHFIYSAHSKNDSTVCYAASKDGFEWYRPNLEQVEFEGSLQNNIIADGPRGGGGIFEDPTASSEERFKAIGQVGGWFDPDTNKLLSGDEGYKRSQAQEYGGENYKGPRTILRYYVAAWHSPDRIHWEKSTLPVGNFPSDGGNSTGYDAVTGMYYTYMRVHGLEPTEFKAIGAGIPEETVGRRSIGLSRTKDFSNWPPPKLVLYPDGIDPPDLSYYGANYFRYPGRDDIHGMFVQNYHQITDNIDNQIAFSRDGLLWYRHDRSPIIESGKPGSGYEGLARSRLNGLIDMENGWWATLHEGTPWLHNSSWNVNVRRNFNPKEEQNPGQIFMALWKPHRLCGFNAEGHGQFTLQARARRHKELKLNYRCEAGGWIDVELMENIPSRLTPDAIGPVKGFSFTDCDRLTGDSIEKSVTWKGNSDISAVGETIAIRIKMFRTKLFAFFV